jgi:hypothetical protein
VAKGHFVVDIIPKKILDASYWCQLYSRIFMNFVEVVTIVRKLDDQK